jgi:hypothetical protein
VEVLVTNKNSPLSLYQTATRLLIPVNWLRQEALAGRIPHLRAGRRLFFNLKAVERAIALRATGLGVAHA